MEEAIRLAAEGTAGFHLSLDMDFVRSHGRPGVGTPVRGGATYREAHLAMEMICDSRRMVSMEVVEVNPVIDEVNRTADFAVELIMSGLGKRIYENTSSRHLWRPHRRARSVGPFGRSAIMAALDPAKYEKIEYFIDQQGKWLPEADPAGTRRPPGHRRGLPRPARDLRRGRHGAGLLELADLPYVGAGVMASAVSMDKEMMKRVCKERMLPVVDYVVAARGQANVDEIIERLLVRCKDNVSKT